MHTAVNPVLTKYGLREEQKENYAVLRETAMDAILTETAFIDTAFDANLLKIHNLLKISQAYANGIAAIFGVAPNPQPLTHNRHLKRRESLIFLGKM